MLSVVAPSLELHQSFAAMVPSWRVSLAEMPTADNPTRIWFRVDAVGEGSDGKWRRDPGVNSRSRESVPQHDVEPTQLGAQSLGVHVDESGELGRRG